MAADSTQYLIDIAAKLAGGDDVGAKLVQIANGLTGVDSAAKAFDAALAGAKSQLEQAKAAAASTSSALADGETKYSQLEKAAVRAAAALEKAKQKGKPNVDLEIAAIKTAGALETEAAALDQLRSKAAAAATEQKRLEGSVKGLEAAAKSAKAFAVKRAQIEHEHAQQRMKDFAAQLAASGKANAAAGGSGKVNEMSEAFGKLGGPVGAAGQKVLGLAEGFNKLGGSLGAGVGAAAASVVVVVALAAAVVALGVAAGAATVKIAAWGVELADANRNAGLAVEAMAKANPALAGIDAVLPGLAQKTGLASSKLLELAGNLAEAKVKAADIPDALEAIAVAEAAGAGSTYTSKLVEDLKAGKKTAGELAAEVNAKFGGIVSRKLLSLDAQAAKLKSNLQGTFGGLKIEGLLEGLSKLVGLFDKNTASGRFLKAVFEGLFQPIIDGAAASLPLVKGFVLGVAIAATKLYIAFKPAIKAVSELFGETSPDLKTGLDVAVFAGKALGAAIGTVVAGVALLAAAVAAPVIAFGRLYGAGYTAWESIKAGAAAAVAYLESVSLADIGTALIQGLADGITGGGSKVISALGGVVQSAITAAKQKLGIASPSKVFEKLGGFTAEGFAGGVEDGAGAAQAATQAMVEAPSAGGGGGVGGGLNFAGATFIFNGVANAEQAEGRFRELLLRIITGDVLTLGGREPEPEPG